MGYLRTLIPRKFNQRNFQNQMYKLGITAAISAVARAINFSEPKVNDLAEQASYAQAQAFEQEETNLA